MHLHKRERTGGRKRPQGTVPVSAPQAENASPRPISHTDEPPWQICEDSVVPDGSQLNILTREQEVWASQLACSSSSLLFISITRGLYSCRARPCRVFHRNAATRRHHYLHIRWRWLEREPKGAAGIRKRLSVRTHKAKRGLKIGK